ncbi:MAG: hypothetical protein KAJ01_03225 [Candidatus Hydrogenedentes bacterium]|nr:hypothetical protein [Candidatus Hydrogenedentota bacterium]
MKWPKSARQQWIDTLQGRIRRAAVVGFALGDLPGDDHKQWVIDGMLRYLLGDAYEKVRDNTHPNGWSTGRAHEGVTREHLERIIKETKNDD